MSPSVTPGAAVTWRRPLPDSKTEIAYAPFCLWRRGNLAHEDLQQLVPARTWAILDALEQARLSRLGKGAELREQLYKMVPTAERSQRGPLVQIQRDIFNDHLPREGTLSEVGALLGPSANAALEAWMGALEDERAETERARIALEEETMVARRKLGELAARPDLATGVQLSGAALYRRVKALAAAVHSGGAPPPRLHHLESRLVSFLYRMALKPSPFGSFTEIGFQRWQLDPDEDTQVPPVRVRLARLSRMLLLWMERQLELVQECREGMPLRLNNTLAARNGSLVFFTRGHDGTQHMLSGEQFVRLRATPLLESVVDGFRDKRPTRKTLVDRLVASGCEPQEAGSLIERLIELGLVERSLGLPDQEPDYAARMADVLSCVPGDRAGACLGVVRNLAAAEQSFAGATVDLRERLLTEIRSEVDHFSALLGVQGPSEEDMRAPIFEEVGSVGASTTWDPEALDAAAVEIGLLQRLLPLFDDALSERLGLYDFFCRHYAPGQACDDMLGFYREFAKLDSGVLSEYMRGETSEAVADVRRLRRRFFRYLSGRLMEDPAQSGLVLETAWVRDFVDGFPEFLQPWGSAAYRLQRVGETPDDRRVVLNGVATGYGMMFSRFCDLLSLGDRPDHFSLRDELAKSIGRRQRTAKQVDLTAVLGMNYNLHPALTEFQLEYPRAQAAPDEGRVLYPRDLVLVPEPKSRRVAVHLREDGHEVNLMPLNGMFPGAAPSLYRFLCALAPLVNYRGDLWDRYLLDPEVTTPTSSSFPRVLLGTVVVERRCWRHAVVDLPPAPTEEDGVSFLLEGKAWGEGLGLPREGFFRFRDSAPKAAERSTWVEETKRRTQAARRGRLHKPHYVDFRNPFLLRILFKQLRSRSDGLMTLQECLPATSVYAGTWGLAAAEEFVIEV